MATVGRVNPFVEKLVAVGSKISLSDEQFEAVSTRAEHELKNNSSLYSFKVLALALVGYAFIGLVLLFVVGALWLAWRLANEHRASYGLQLAIPLGLALWALLKSLWIKMPPPEGILLKRDQAPELFRMIDELSSVLNTKVDKVLLDDNCNAAVVQVPLLGLGGVFRNYMLLGLPLMLTQDALQFKAILAHELGHLSGNHSRSSAWIYKLRARWSNLLDNSENDAFFTVFFLFTSWFSPRFNAYSLALARAHELDADADAAKVTSALSQSQSLLRVKRDGVALEEHFWDDIYALAKREATPPRDVFKQLKVHACTYQPSKSDLRLQLKSAFEDTSAGFSTHPSLKQRLLCGKFEPVIKLDEQNQLEDSLLDQLVLPIDSEKSAAAVYFGEGLDRALELVSERWADGVAVAWAERHASFVDAYRRLGELSEKERTGALTVDELREKASIVAITASEADSLPIHIEILARDSESAIAQYNVGILLLRTGDDDGLSLLRQAINKSFSLVGDACPVIIAYLKKHERLEEVPFFEELLKRYSEEALKAKKERTGIDVKADLEPHQLSIEQTEYLSRVFKQFDGVTHVYVVRKKMHYFPDLPFLVLGVEMNGYDDGEELNLALWLVNNLLLSQEFCVSTFNLGSNDLKEKIMATPNSLVYSKHRKK